MAIFKCPECDSDISTLAKSCPNCGFPLSSETMKSRIGIPAIPKEIWDGLRIAARSGNFLDWKVREGDWIKKGEKIASYNVESFKATHYSRGKILTKATIDAPISGLVSKIQRIEYFSWDWGNLITGDCSWYWKDDDEKPHLSKENILVFIDTPLEIEYASKAYASYENIVDYGYFARTKIDGGLFRKSMFESTDFPLHSLEGLANSPLRLDKLKRER